jgi:uncharacterized protein
LSRAAIVVHHELARMHTSNLLAALAGGLLIGLGSLALLAATRRVVGVSGVVAGLLPPRRGELAWRLAFLCGLWTGGLLLLPRLPAALPVSRTTLVIAGLLVGLGARLGGGCTSGHGVCGLGRRSPRSLAAVLTFMSTAFITVYITRHLLRGAL